MNNMSHCAELLGRIFLAVIFLISGVGKIEHFNETQGYMASAGVPDWLLSPVIALEVVGAAAIILGWHTRFFSLGLAGYTLLAGILFHANFQDQIQMNMLLKNVAITGGFLVLYANGVGFWSLDAHRSPR